MEYRDPASAAAASIKEIGHELREVLICTMSGTSGRYCRASQITAVLGGTQGMHVTAHPNRVRRSPITHGGTSDIKSSMFDNTQKMMMRT